MTKSILQHIPIKVLTSPLAWSGYILIYYLYIYAPPFVIIPFGLDKIILILSFWYISAHHQWRDLWKTFQSEFQLLILICVVSFIICIVHRKGVGLFMYDCLLLLEAIPCAYALWRYFQKKGIKDKYKIIIYSAILGGVITAYLISDPALMQHLKESVLKYPDRLKISFLYRGYGLSDGLLFSYPVIQGYCIGIVLITLNKWNPVVVSGIILFGTLSIVLNARSGFVPVAVAIGIAFFYNFPRFFKFVFISVIVVLIFGNILHSYIESNEMLSIAAEWSKSSIDIISDLIEGKKTENIDTLTGDMLFFPTSIDEWLIGQGVNVGSSTDVPRNSDIGYVIRLMYGGMIYLLFWFFLLLTMFKRMRAVDNKLSLLVFISLIYLNYKGDYFVVVPASRFFFLIYVWTIMNSIHRKDLAKNIVCS